MTTKLPTFILGCYGLVGVYLFPRSIDFFIHYRIARQLRIPYPLEFVGCMVFSTISSALWPIAIPAQILYADTERYNKHRFD
jgi:hypothetical protein